MSILIELSRAVVECLRGHVPPEASHLWDTLEHTDLISMAPTERPLEFTHAIDCKENEARDLLRIATEHCSEAVSKIQHAMREARVIF
jgi:hypothetical protein